MSLRTFENISFIPVNVQNNTTDSKNDYHSRVVGFSSKYVLEVVMVTVRLAT